MKRVLVILVVGVVLFGTSAQRAEAQSTNIAQKIIGTWIDQVGRTWVFNANGIHTLTYSNGNTSEYKFGVTDTMLAVQSSGGDTWVYYFSISSDGRTLIVKVGYETDGYLLTKK